MPGVAGGAVVATTRPETMLGDTALAIHPEDPADGGAAGQDGDPADRGRGSSRSSRTRSWWTASSAPGIVKVTPAHDANDFAVGQRHGLPAVVVIGPDGKMTAEAGEFAGLDRFEARKRIVARLEAGGPPRRRPSRTRSTSATASAATT